MKPIFAALALAATFALPVASFAMDDMTCADYSAMTPEKQAETVAMMHDSGGMMAAPEGAMAAPEGAMAAPEGAMAAPGAMMADDTTTAVSKMCGEHPDMMLGDAMKGAM